MSKILGYRKIGKKGEITLTKEIREFLKIKSGEYIVFLDDKGQLVIKKGNIEIKTID